MENKKENNKNNKNNLTNEEKLKTITNLIRDAEKKLNMDSVELIKKNEKNPLSKQLFSANSIGKIAVPKASTKTKNEARKNEEDIISKDEEIACKAKKIDIKIK